MHIGQACTPPITVYIPMIYMYIYMYMYMYMHACGPLGTTVSQHNLLNGLSIVRVSMCAGIRCAALLQTDMVHRSRPGGHLSLDARGYPGTIPRQTAPYPPAGWHCSPGTRHTYSVHPSLHTPVSRGRPQWSVASVCA